MSVVLGWLGVCVGAAGCVATYLLAGGSAAVPGDSGVSKPIAWRAAAVSLGAAVVFWAIGMLTRVPFSPGQGLAFGFLIGGVTGAIAILLSFRLGRIVSAQGTLRSARLASLSSIFLAVFSASLAYSLFASNPWESLMGFAMGATMAATLHAYMQRVSIAELPVRTEIWALCAVTIAAAILLAMRHFNAAQLRMWWSMPILIATSIAVADYIGIELASLGRFRENSGGSFVLSSLIAAVLVAGLTAIYSFSIFHEWQLLGVVGVGLVIGGVICWLMSSLRGASASDGLEVGAACVLLIVAFFTVAFKLWSGLGIAVGLLGVWAVAIPGMSTTARTDRTSSSFEDRLSLSLVFGLVVLLFKLFLDYYHHDLRTADVQVHYTFIGALLGATLPFILSAALIRLREGRAGAVVLGVALMGLAAAVAPLLLLVLWEIKAVLGFAFGLTAAMAFMTYARLSGEHDRYSAGLLAVASQLTAIQFAGPLMAAEITRGVRIIVLAAAVVMLIVWLGLSGLYAARREH